MQQGEMVGPKGWRGMIRRLHIVAVSLLVFLCGCGSGGSGTSVSTSPGTSIGKMYVSNAANNSIVRFDNALTVTGNVSPAATISGASTQLAAPQYLFLDVPANRLFVANQGAGSIVIFESVNTRTGNVAPDRTISGPATLLVSPVDLAVDSGRNLLYVADGSSIFAFAAASSINGNAPPVRNIAVGFTPSAIFLDQTNDRLYAANSAGNAIHIYDGVSLLNNAVAANRIISGAATQLNKPAGLQVDAAGRLIVSNFNAPSITVYANAATANGNVLPAAAIMGASTSLIAPTQIILNTATTGGDLYLADGGAGSVLIFANIASASGNTAPTRNVNGSNTGLARAGGAAFTAKGIALDTTR